MLNASLVYERQSASRHEKIKFFLHSILIHSHRLMFAVLLLFPIFLSRASYFLLQTQLPFMTKTYSLSEVKSLINLYLRNMYQTEAFALFIFFFLDIIISKEKRKNKKYIYPGNAQNFVLIKILENSRIS